MRIALLGGTGDIGEGLALRLGHDTDHDVIVGSREVEKAERKANEYEKILAKRDNERSIDGLANDDAAANADVIVLSVPAYYLTDTVEAVADDIGDAILVSPAVGMSRDEAGMHYNPPDEGSVTALAFEAAPEGVPVAAAYHNLAAGKLANLDVDLNADVPIVADDDDAKEVIAALTTDVDGLRPLDAGPLTNAAEIEALTPLLINLAANNDGMHDLGVTFH